MNSVSLQISKIDKDQQAVRIKTKGCNTSSGDTFSDYTLAFGQFELKGLHKTKEEFSMQRGLKNQPLKLSKENSTKPGDTVLVEMDFLPVSSILGLSKGRANFIEISSNSVQYYSMFFGKIM